MMMAGEHSKKASECLYEVWLIPETVHVWSVIEPSVVVCKQTVSKLPALVEVHGKLYSVVCMPTCITGCSCFI